MFRCFWKSNIFKYFSTCQTRSNEFWFLNATCTFINLLLYISHLLLSSQQASIAMWTILISKSLMMVTETETLTSTLHHNIFTYLDSVFSATFILSDFIHIYFDIYIYYIYTYIYIYIYINWILKGLYTIKRY